MRVGCSQRSSTRFWPARCLGQSSVFPRAPWGPLVLVPLCVFGFSWDGGRWGQSLAEVGLRLAWAPMGEL